MPGDELPEGYEPIDRPSANPPAAEMKTDIMTTIEAEIPDYLARQALAAAEREKIPVDQLIALALAAQLAAWRGSDDMARRAKRTNLHRISWPARRRFRLHRETNCRRAINAFRGGAASENAAA